MQLELKIDIQIQNPTYRIALAEFEKYSAIQKQPVFLVYIEKEERYTTWNHCSRKSIETYAGFKIIKSTDKIN